MFDGSPVTLLFGSKICSEIKEDIQKFSLHNLESVQNFIISEKNISISLNIGYRP